MSEPSHSYDAAPEAAATVPEFPPAGSVLPRIGGRGLVVLGFALLVAAALLPFVSGVDLAAERVLQGWRTTRGTVAFQVVSGATRPIGVILLGIALALLVRHRRLSRAALETLAALVAGTILIEGLKDLLARPRPNAESLWLPGSSFPSGHVGNVLLYGVGAVCLLGRNWRQGAAARALLLVAMAVALVGASRVYLACHWLTDVLGTAALFGGYAVFAIAHPDGRVRRRTIVVAATAAGLALGLAAAGCRFQLPTGLARAAVPVASLDFGTALAEGRLGGAWARARHETERSAAVLRARDATIDLGISDPRPRTIRLVGRPLGASEAPRRLRVELNGTELGIPLLLPDWRAYAFAVPAAIWSDSDNTLTLHVQSEATGTSLPDGPLVAFSTLELFAPRTP